jgi:hypothetical protein
VRAADAEPVTTADGSLTLDGLAPLPEVSEAARLAPSRRQHVRRFVGVGLAVAAIVVLAAAGTLYVRSPGMRVNVGQVSRVTAAAADAVGAVVMTGVSAVSDTAGLGRLVPADEIAAPPKPADPPPALRGSTKVARRGASVEPDSPMALRTEEPFGTVVAYEMPSLVVTAIAMLPEQAPTSEIGVEAATAHEIYTFESEGVTPPIDVRQQLRRSLPPSVDLSDLSRIEIVIASDGSVESARLLDNRPDVLGGMLLSAVKTWEFYPATKDSAAVRYRKILLVSLE